ncbi:hypothetical protein [Lewinella sp. LCG006]|uniref:hypothetical protein n=1 Tax=Lewinella sp. LCG006 TaxID=3231911 RepID=UPI0034614694
MMNIVLLIFENIVLIDASSKLWDDLLRTKNVFLIIFLGLILIAYRIFVVLSRKKEKQGRQAHEKQASSKVNELLAVIDGVTKKDMMTKLRTLIANGDTEIALDVFLQYVKRTDSVFQDKYYRSSLKVSNRFYTAKKSFKNGDISDADYQVQLNQINSSLIDMFVDFQREY